MSGDMGIGNGPAPNSMNTRKRPLTDAMEMNTPKREYYQNFQTYQYMNMMTPPPMFHSTPFSMRGDENQPPPQFMAGEFCQPIAFPSYTPFSCSSANSSVLSNSSSNDSGISGGSSSSSCETSPSTSSEPKSKDDEVLFQVPSRLNHISKNKVTLAELKRRIAAPECLNSSFLGIYLRLRILDELNGMFNELQTPLGVRIQNNIPIHHELEVGMNHFSLITHTFGPINQSTWCNAFLNYAKMSLAMYQGRMEPSNPQYNQ
ncbi:transcription factor AP-2 [Necator americanus]|uniref:Transcription factor AP-2 n=1 Tax=Necator americanus TaxID=51031 RepID=W2TS78_NECAM|nr:transcription factor AP-2 [Necator americanus]ETN83971.1 transcription factor AP-2 [Necator americanus]